jgi:hypothetical protein
VAEAQIGEAARTSGYVFNVSDATVITSPLSVTDGALSVNTSVSGVVLPYWRIKYQPAGVYSGGTTLTVNAKVVGGAPLAATVMGG